MKTETNFEEWAKLLINRKVPNDFSHLINPELIHTGADILKRGHAFEVHLVSTEVSTQNQIRVTPMPHFA